MEQVAKISTGRRFGMLCIFSTDQDSQFVSGPDPAFRQRHPDQHEWQLLLAHFDNFGASAEPLEQAIVIGLASTALPHPRRVPLTMSGAVPC